MSFRQRHTGAQHSGSVSAELIKLKGGKALRDGVLELRHIFSELRREAKAQEVELACCNCAMRCDQMRYRARKASSGSQ